MDGMNDLSGAGSPGDANVVRCVDPATEGLGASIVCAIAEATERDPLDLDGTLNDSIDSDALAALLRSSDDVTVEFEAFGHRVTASAGGRIEVNSAGSDRS